MSASEHSTALDHEAAQKVSLRTLLERRRRIWRRLLLMIVVTVTIIVLALVQRDTQRIRYHAGEMERIAEALRGAMEQKGAAPEVLSLARSDSEVATRYLFNVNYRQHAERRGRSAVCAMREPVPLLLRPNRRYVILFDGRQFSVRWMTEAEFATQSEPLGLGRPGQD
jgi:hypothetical protein